ncbi:MAG TPA: ABC transporter permease, partial [Polyangiales bacterium]
NYFALLGAKPQIGALFDPSDHTPGFNGQIVISDGAWRRAFGTDPKVVGRVVQLDSDSYRVVGVMPPGFQAPERASEARNTDIWVAMGFAGLPTTTFNLRTPLVPGAIARLAPGLTIAEAQGRVDALVASLRQRYPADYPAAVDWQVRLVPLRDYVVGDMRQPLLFLLGAVGLMLLIACANVANLVLARATTRKRELAVRQAIGSAPSRLTRQLLTESVLLSTFGGALGVAFACVSSAAIARVVPAAVPQLNVIAIDWQVLAFAFAVSLAAGVLFGVAPAWQVRRLDVTSVLKQEGRGSTSGGEQARARRAIVIAEFALSLTLIIAAALLVRSFSKLLDAPLGFEPRGVTVARTRLPYPNDSIEDLYSTAGAEASFVREVIQRVRALRAVEDVALGSGAAVPLDHPEQDQPVFRLLIERRATPANQPLIVTGSEVTPEYFRLLGIPLVRGRLLDDFDTDSTPLVAVVNEALAEKYWPNEEVIGHRVKLSQRATQWATIVGVVGDTRSESLLEPRHPQVYASLYQKQGRHLAIFVRGRAGSGALERDLRAGAQSINPALPVFGARTLVETIAAS